MSMGAVIFLLNVQFKKIMASSIKKKLFTVLFLLQLQSSIKTPLCNSNL